MKVTVKLALCLSGLLVLLVSEALYSTYHFETKFIAARDAAQAQQALETLAMDCTAALDEKREDACLQALKSTLAALPAGLVRQAYLCDSRNRVLLHSDFLDGDYSLRGSSAEDPRLRGPAPTTRLIKRISAPVPFRRVPPGTMVLVCDLEAWRLSFSRLGLNQKKAFLGAIFRGTGLGTLAAVLLILYFLSPIDDLSRAAKRVAAGDYSTRMPQRKEDELGSIAAIFNSMSARLAEIESTKDLFLAQISHDLRTPLNVIVSKADNLAQGVLGRLEAKQAEAARIILASADALTSLIENILEVTRLDSGRMELHPADIDLPQEIGAVLESWRPFAEECGVGLSYSPSPDLPRARADPKAFSRVLGNLVCNAIQFTPKGGRVEVGVRREDPGELAVSVLDTGIGIPKGRLGELFGKFHKVRETRNKVRPTRGAGLGLYVARKWTEANGGRIRAASELFKGSEFTFTLKACPGENSNRP